MSLSQLSCSDGSSVHTGRTRCELNFEKLTISPITFTFDSMAREQTALVTPQRERERERQRAIAGGEGDGGEKNANKEVVDRLSKEWGQRVAT